MITKASVSSWLDRHKEWLLASCVETKVLYDDADQCFIVDLDAAQFVAQIVVYVDGSVDAVVYTREHGNGVVPQIDQQLSFDHKLDSIVDFIQQYA